MQKLAANISIEQLLKDGFRLTEVHDRYPEHGPKTLQHLTKPFDCDMAYVSRGQGLWLVDFARRQMLHFTNASCGGGHKGAMATIEILSKMGFDREIYGLDAVTVRGFNEHEFKREG